MKLLRATAILAAIAAAAGGSYVAVRALLSPESGKGGMSAPGPGDGSGGAGGADSASGGAGPGSRGAPEMDIRWHKDPGVRVQDGSVPFITRASGAGYRLYFCGPGGIRSATSRDGTTFAAEEGVRVAAGPPGSGEEAVCDPSVIGLEGGRARMYYKGAKGQGGPGQAVHTVYSALTRDGVSFEKEGVRIDPFEAGDEGWASVPEAVELPDGRVRIYYVSGDPEVEGGTMSAISADGLRFRKERGARAKSIVDPAVLVLRPRGYLMLGVVLGPPPGPAPARPGGAGSARKPGIYAMTSADGLRFGDRRTVLRESGVFDPTIIRLSRTTFRVFYGKDTGSPGRPRVVTMSLTGRLR